ncbi:hypothetical protein VPH35_040764 [Triticum aestivum]
MARSSPSASARAPPSSLRRQRSPGSASPPSSTLRSPTGRASRPCRRSPSTTGRSLARRAPRRRRAPPLRAPRRPHVRRRRRPGAARPGAPPRARCRGWRREGGAEAAAVRPLPQRPHGGHRAEQEHLLRRRSGHVPGGAGDEGHRGRHRAARRCRQPVGLPSGAALARLARRQAAAGGRNEPEERLHLQAHRRGEAEAVERCCGCRRQAAGGGGAEHDRRHALAAEVRARPVHGHFHRRPRRQSSWRRDRDDVDDDGMGDGAAAEPPGGAKGGTGRDRHAPQPHRRAEPPPRQEGPAPPSLPPLHHQRDAAAVPRRAAAAAARGRRRLPAPRVRRRRGHDRARQRIRHPPRPGGVGTGARGVQAGEVRAWQRRGEGHDAVRDGQAQVPRGEPGHEDHGLGSWHADPVLRLEKGRGRRGRHGREFRDRHVQGRPSGSSLHTACRHGYSSSEDVNLNGTVLL